MNIHVFGGSGYFGRAFQFQRQLEGDFVTTGRLVDPIPPETDGVVLASWPRKNDLEHNFQAFSLDIFLENVINAAQRIADRGLPFVFTSSGQAGVGGLYGRTKEYMEQKLFNLPGFHKVRFGTLFGPSPNMRWDLVVNSMLRSALMEGAVYVSHLEAQRTHCHIRLAIDRVRDLLDSDKPSPASDDVATFTCSMIELAQGISQLTHATIRQQIGISARAAVSYDRPTDVTSAGIATILEFFYEKLENFLE